MLILGNMISTVIQAISTIIVARLLGPEGYGLYTIALVIPSTLQLAVGFGVNSSITRYSAYHISKGEPKSAKQITLHGVMFLVLVGSVVTFANLGAAGYLAASVLHRSEITLYIQESSFLIIAQTLFQAGMAAYIGWGRMITVSLSTILQSLLKLGVAPTLILFGFGVYGAILGQVASYMLAGLVAVMILFQILRGIHGSGSSTSFRRNLREMISYGFPIFTGGVVSGLASLYLIVLLALISTNAVVGYYQAATNVTAAITLISSAIASSLFPAFATIDGLKEDIVAALRYSVKYVAFIMTPVVMFVFGASNLLISLFYGPFYVEGIVLLKLLALSYVPVCIGLTVTPTFFNGVGRSRLMMLQLILGAVVLVAGALILTFLGLGIYGLVISVLLSNLMISVSGLYLSAKLIGASINLRPLIGILVASILADLAMSAIPHFTIDLFMILIEAAIFLAVYVTVIPLLRSLVTADILRLSTAADGLGPVARLLKPVIKYEHWLLKLSSRDKRRIGRL